MIIIARVLWVSELLNRLWAAKPGYRNFVNGVLERERLISEQEENERLKAKRKARELGPQFSWLLHGLSWHFMLHFFIS